MDCQWRRASRKNCAGMGLKDQVGKWVGSLGLRRQSNWQTKPSYGRVVQGLLLFKLLLYLFMSRPSSAFNSISHPKLLQIMKNLGLDHRAVWWLQIIKNKNWEQFVAKLGVCPSWPVVKHWQAAISDRIYIDTCKLHHCYFFYVAI